MEIFKIQKPLSGHEELIIRDKGISYFQGILVYNKDRSFCKVMPFTTEAVDILFGENGFLVYALAEIDENGLLQIKSIAEEQDW